MFQPAYHSFTSYVGYLYHVPAILKDGKFELVDQVGGTEVMDDAVDEVIEAVLAMGGEVAIVDDGALSVHQQMALTLRY